MNIRTSIATAATLAIAATALAAAPANASHGNNDKVRSGSCSASTDWKVKAGADDGRIEFEGEIDSNHIGQTWHWRIRHNGSVSAHGTKTTKGPSGSFEVHRRLVNLSGKDKIVFRATNANSGEICRGVVRF
jgi:hypothetical protein